MDPNRGVRLIDCALTQDPNHGVNRARDETLSAATSSRVCGLPAQQLLVVLDGQAPDEGADHEARHLRRERP
jgi:hypothetical protein